MDISTISASFQEQLLQLPYYIFLAVCCFGIIDICRAIGIIRLTEDDRVVSEVLKTNPSTKPLVCERALDATLTAICTIIALYCLVRSEESVGLTILTVILMVSFVRLMVSLHSRYMFALKDKESIVTNLNK
jgi:hypothetical protein